MATTTTPKPTPPTRRPVLRPPAATVPTLAPVAHQVDRQEVAHQVGYATGLSEGMKLGAERVRAHAPEISEADLELQISQMIDKKAWPTALRAMDQTLAWLIYALGAGCIIGLFTGILRALRWM